MGVLVYFLYFFYPQMLVGDPAIYMMNHSIRFFSSPRWIYNVLMFALQDKMTIKAPLKLSGISASLFSDARNKMCSFVELWLLFPSLTSLSLTQTQFEHQIKERLCTLLLNLKTLLRSGATFNNVTLIRCREATALHVKVF